MAHPYCDIRRNYLEPNRPLFAIWRFHGIDTEKRKIPRYVVEMPTRAIQWAKDCTCNSSIATYREAIAYYRYNKRHFIARRLRFFQVWKLEFDRELERRKNPDYRGFINKIIHEPRNRYIHLLTFADWLQDKDRHLESRRILAIAAECKP